MSPYADPDDRRLRQRARRAENGYNERMREAFRKMDDDARALSALRGISFSEARTRLRLSDYIRKTIPVDGESVTDSGISER